MPTKFNAGTSTDVEISSAQKQKDAAQQDVRTLAMQKKKQDATTATEKAFMEKEHTTKAQVE